MTDHDDISRVARQLLSLAPQVAHALASGGDELSPDPDFPLSWLSRAGRAVADVMTDLSGTQRREVFALMERELVGGSETVKAGVATCFLEALASEVSSGRLDGPFLATLLGPESRAHLDAWDQFTMGRSTLDPPA